MLVFTLPFNLPKNITRSYTMYGIKFAHDKCRTCETNSTCPLHSDANKLGRPPVGEMTPELALDFEIAMAKRNYATTERMAVGDKHAIRMWGCVTDGEDMLPYDLNTIQIVLRKQGEKVDQLVKLKNLGAQVMGGEANPRDVIKALAGLLGGVTEGMEGSKSKPVKEGEHPSHEFCHDCPSVESCATYRRFCVEYGYANTTPPPVSH